MEAFFYNVTGISGLVIICLANIQCFYSELLHSLFISLQFLKWHQTVMCRKRLWTYS